MSMTKMPSSGEHAERGLQYARDVVGGKIVSGHLLKAACQRALDDLERQNTTGFPYRFDPEVGSKVARWIERFPHVKSNGGSSRTASGRIKLEGWQCFVITQVFGWLVVGGVRDGMRRFRRSYIEVGRGNGKSTLTSPVALWMLGPDGAQGAEVYSAATTQTQARIVFDDARAMILARPSLADLTGITASAHRLNVPKRNSKFVPLSSKGKTLDGLNIHFACVDEVHAHKDRHVWDVVVTGASKRPNSLVWAISTAGFDLSGIGYEIHTHARKILEGAVKEETQFAVIYSIDEGDDWQSPDVLIKANPNLGISVDLDYTLGLIREAQAMPSKQPNVMTKVFNMWLSGGVRWADLKAWKDARDENLKVEDFIGKRCFIGLDLSAVSDITAKVLVFPEMRDGKRHYTVFPTYYLPKATLSDGRNASYAGWQIEGHIKAIPGNVIDYDLVRADILKDIELYDVRKICIDPYEARDFTNQMMQMGHPIVTIPQNVAVMSSPAKELDAASRSKRLHLPLEPVTLWMASNVEVRPDTNDNIKPRKAADKEENKIDGIVAIVNALAEIMVEQPTRKPRMRMVGFGAPPPKDAEKDKEKAALEGAK